MDTQAEPLRLLNWRKQYVEAARINDLDAMRRLITQLAAHLRSASNSPAEMRTGFSPGTWQHLCVLAQNEYDTDKLLKLIAEINRLLGEELTRKPNR